MRSGFYTNPLVLFAVANFYFCLLLYARCRNTRKSTTGEKKRKQRKKKKQKRKISKHPVCCLVKPPIKRRNPRNKSRSHPPGKSAPDKRQTVVGRGLVVDPATRSNAKSTAYNRGNSSSPSPLPPLTFATLSPFLSCLYYRVIVSLFVSRVASNTHTRTHTHTHARTHARTHVRASNQPL